MIMFKSDGTNLAKISDIKAEDTTALIASDFAGEGIELGKPVHLIRPTDRSLYLQSTATQPVT